MNENKLKQNTENNDEKIVSGFFHAYKNSIVPDKNSFRKFVMEKLNSKESFKEVQIVASPYQVFISKTSFFTRGLAFAVIILILAQASVHNKTDKVTEVTQVNNLRQEQINLALARIDTAATDEIKKTPYTETPVLMKTSKKDTMSSSARKSDTDTKTEVGETLQSKTGEGVGLDVGRSLENVKSEIKEKTNTGTLTKRKEVASEAVEVKSDLEVIVDNSYEEKL